MKCAKCIAWRGIDQADDAVTIIRGTAVCGRHVVVLEDKRGNRTAEPFAHLVKEWEQS